jgi:hypothetical protein
MKFGRGDFESSAHGESETILYPKSAEHRPGVRYTDVLPGWLVRTILPFPRKSG